MISIKYFLSCQKRYLNCFKVVKSNKIHKKHTTWISITGKILKLNDVILHFDRVLRVPKAGFDSN